MKFNTKSSIRRGKEEAKTDRERGKEALKIKVKKQQKGMNFSDKNLGKPHKSSY